MALDFLLISAGAIIIALTVASVRSLEAVCLRISNALGVRMDEQTFLYMYITALFTAFVLQGLRGPGRLWLRRADSGEPVDSNSEPASAQVSAAPATSAPPREPAEVPDDLICSVAHDFNNILTGVLGHLFLARSETVPARIHDLINVAETECSRAAELSRQLLEFAKGPAAVIREFPLPKIIESCPLLEGDSVSHIDIPDSTWDLRVDVSQTSEAIMNCINYMRQAFPVDNTLTIKAVNLPSAPPEAGDLCSLAAVHLSMTAVQNEDAIITPALQAHAAEMIPLKSRTGLKMAASLIERQGGTMLYNDDSGPARSIDIFFDAVKGSGAREEVKEAPRKGRILVLDDEPIVRDLARHLLESFGYSVDCANDEKSAIDLYLDARTSGNPFDAVIVDINMRTGADGDEILRKLRGIDSDIRAIASSGNPQHPVIKNFEKFGFLDVIHKPYRPEVIAEIVDAVVAMKPL